VTADDYAVKADLPMPHHGGGREKVLADREMMRDRLKVIAEDCHPAEAMEAIKLLLQIPYD
jgi:hypothetical protein